MLEGRDVGGVKRKALEGRDSGLLLGLELPFCSSHTAAAFESGRHVQEVVVGVALHVRAHALDRSVAAHAHQVGGASMASVAVGQAGAAEASGGGVGAKASLKLGTGCESTSIWPTKPENGGRFMS